MGIHGMRNLFESNEPEIPREDLDQYSDNLHSILPEAPEGKGYDIVRLSDGRDAVVVKDVTYTSYFEEKSRAERAAEEDLNSPESRTLRHRD